MKAMTARRILILIVLPLLFSLKPVFPADNLPAAAFGRASVYYEEGNFDEAIKQYNGILESGLESGSLYYNLGNCYFKKGELGKAIFNYEKARRLIPLDKDLEANYEYARSLIEGARDLPGKGALLRMFNGLFERFSVDGLTVSLSVFYMLILIAVSLSLFFKETKKRVLIFCAFMGLFLITGFLGLRSKVALMGREAVVISAQAEARFEPMDKATTYFTLYEGMKVEVVSSKGGWSKVRRRDNKSAWVENSVIAVF